LEEAISNLLDNAVRYGCPNGGKITVTVAFQPDSVTITVADQGPGIPQALRERVFDRFFRGGDAHVDGSGLGLAIVRSIAEAHGGTVRSCEERSGAAIVISLPAVPR
jgi:two-component system sensor histidine kinase TctE